ncbi:MAG TPA: hypothetical protein VM692_06800, partial [Gammaproteobacteria bacterium]|nr:hypothetical protein [Gammaproteobacteria bacterium]
ALFAQHEKTLGPLVLDPFGAIVVSECHGYEYCRTSREVPIPLGCSPARRRPERPDDEGWQQPSNDQLIREQAAAEAVQSARRELLAAIARGD